MIQCVLRFQVKHGGVSVMAGACMAAAGTDSLIFTEFMILAAERIQELTLSFRLPIYREMHSIEL